jgi:hypothetical protein
MTRHPVKSSNLKSVGYDSKTGTLEVEFNSGAVHQYHGVLPHLHTKLMAAKSPGSYFHAEIRDKHKSSQAG